MIKRSVKEEDITTVNIYAPNIGEPKCVKKKKILTDIKGELDKSKIIIKNLLPHCHQWRASRQKINKAKEVLNNTIDQFDLIDIYRTLHPKKTIHILFKCTQNIL